MKSCATKHLTLEEMLEELERKVENLVRLCAGTRKRIIKQVVQAFEGIDRRASAILNHPTFEISGVGRENIDALVDRARSHMRRALVRAGGKKVVHSTKPQLHQENQERRAEEQRRAAHDRKYGHGRKAS